MLVSYLLIAEGKRSTISTYLDEIENFSWEIDDIGILDYTIVKLLPNVASIRAHLVQPTEDDEVECHSFEIKENFQNNQIQLQFNKVKTAGRKKQNFHSSE